MAETILIVDDSSDHRELLKRFLVSQGYKVEEAENGKVALESILSKPLPELVLLDSEMDVMSGSELLQELENSHSEVLEALPIIVLSGVNKFSHPKISSSLRKPVDFDKLEAAIESALQDQK